MITLNDVKKGEVSLNPEYIERKKVCHESSYGRLNGAATFINYLEPGKSAVHYYVKEDIEAIKQCTG